MACSENNSTLIRRVFDGVATDQERHELEEHMKNCDECRNHFEEIELTVQQIRYIKQEPAPEGFTESVMSRLPQKEEQHSSPWLRWFKAHPLAVAAACFVFLMMGYIFSLWEDRSFQASVQGSGHVQYEGHTVVVPKGEVIKGDLVVQNGEVKIEGKVDGDVILINSDSLLASAGQVTGEIKQVDQILGWIWYHIKEFFQNLFFIDKPFPLNQ